MKNCSSLIFAALACLALTSCSTPVANPATPKANTGYVDFYTDGSLDLAWEIKCADDRSGELKTIYSELTPVEGTVLRLAAGPGARQYRVWIMNRVTKGPQSAQVQVQDGKVTPVHVTLTSESSTEVRTKEFGFRPSAKGYGRGTKISTEESEVYEIGVAPQQPQAYRVKEQMPYFQPAAK